MSFVCAEKYNNSKTFKRIELRKIGDVKFFYLSAKPYI